MLDVCVSECLLHALSENPKRPFPFHVGILPLLLRHCERVVHVPVVVASKALEALVTRWRIVVWKSVSHGQIFS